VFLFNASIISLADRYSAPIPRSRQLLFGKLFRGLSQLLRKSTPTTSSRPISCPRDDIEAHNPRAGRQGLSFFARLA
jgi:hypothetical protein